MVSTSAYNHVMLMTQLVFILHATNYRELPPRLSAATPLSLAESQGGRSYVSFVVVFLSMNRCRALNASMFLLLRCVLVLVRSTMDYQLFSNSLNGCTVSVVLHRLFSLVLQTLHATTGGLGLFDHSPA